MSWYVYLLSSGTRTYVGSTTDPGRRLRQHNGELRGGARATQGKKWMMVAYISGFPDRSSACRWEKIVKLRARGYKKRLDALTHVASGMCPGRGRKYVPPVGLYMMYVVNVISQGSLGSTDSKPNIRN